MRWNIHHPVRPLSKKKKKKKKIDLSNPEPIRLFPGGFYVVQRQKGGVRLDEHAICGKQEGEFHQKMGRKSRDPYTTSRNSFGI